MLRKSIYFCLMFAMCSLWAQNEVMTISLTSGQKISYPVHTISNITFATTTPGLSFTKSIADEYVLASDSYSNYAATIPAVSGEPVLSIKSKSSTLFGGKMSYFNDKDATFGVNKCPSQPAGGYPLYHDTDGGYVHLYNGLNMGYAMALSPDKAAIGEFYYVCRVYKSTLYEALLSGYGAPELKVWDSGKLQFNHGLGTIPNQQFPGTIDPMRTVILHFVYQNNTVGIYITDHLGDDRLLTTLNIPANYFFRNFSIGTSSHPMTHDFFAYIMKFGSNFTPSENAQIIAELKATYPVGQLPNKPMVYPDITYDVYTDSFKLNLNYVAASSGAAFNPNASTIRWYLYDKKNANGPGIAGNGIDKQSIIKTSNGNDLSLKLSDYGTTFDRSSPKNEIAVDVTCMDQNGQQFEVPLPCYPFSGY